MKQELYTEGSGLKVERFDCGRNAIAAVALSVKPSKLYIPHYNCDTVREALEWNHVPYELYYLDDQLEPQVGDLGPDEYILYVNYLGNATKEKIHALEKRYKRILFDNTQAFFFVPVVGEQCFNLYSPRKFVGVSDGAYVVWGNDAVIGGDYPEDVSWERSAFMFKSIELGTNAAYQDNLRSMDHMGQGIRRMSKLTRRILASIDYEEVRRIRQRNIQVLHERLRDTNHFPFEIHGDLMAYPYYVENDLLRRKLVENKIYVSQWWKYLLDYVPETSIEANMTRWLLPLPIDQRYSEEDMEQLAELVLKCKSELE